MPRISDGNDRHLEAALAAWAEFQEPSAWRRSKKGNLYRDWCGKTVTVFRRGGAFRWCTAEDEEQQFSIGAFETEEYAMTDLGEYLGVGFL